MNRRWIGLWLVMMLLACMGCNTSPKERLDGLVAALGFAKDQSATLDAEITEIQKTVSELQTQLDNPDLPQSDAERIREAFAKASAAMESTIAVKKKVDEAIAKSEQTIAELAAQSDVNFGTELEAAAAALQASSSAIPPPYGIYVGIAGTLLGTIGGLVSRRYKNALTDVVKSVDKVKQKMPEQAEVIDETLSKQLDSTRTIVKQIRKEAA